MKTTTRVLSFFALALLFFVLFYTLRGMLLPFVLAIILAYLLNPLVGKLQGQYLPRWLGATIVLFSAIAIMILFLGSIVPVLSVQATTLVQKVSHTDYSVIKTVDGTKTWLSDNLGVNFDGADAQFSPEAIKAWIANKGEELVSLIGKIVQGVLLRSFALVDFISLLVLTPILTFYMLRDWPLFVSKVESLYPMDMRDELRKLQYDIDAALSGFIRGQTLVCVSLGLFYAIALTIAGLDFGLAIGFFSGIISFIPYAGTLLGGFLSIGIAILQFGIGDMSSVGTIAIIFAVGQFVEGNVLSPKLVGDRINLHPVWIIFALFAGANLAGFLGVLIRYSIDKYKSSFLFITAK